MILFNLLISVGFVACDQPPYQSTRDHGALLLTVNDHETLILIPADLSLTDGTPSQ